MTASPPDTTGVTAAEPAGLLVVGHGSRRPEANAVVVELAAALARDPAWVAAEAAFLDVLDPHIPEGYGRLVAAGAGLVVVHPYFLTTGRHTAADIPAALAVAQREHPGTRWLLTSPLGLHPGVVAAARARIGEALDGGPLATGP